MPNFESRAGGDVVATGRNKKQSMADLKLRRLAELNLRLREDLDRPRVKVSEAAMGSVKKNLFFRFLLRKEQALTIYR